MYSVRVYDGAVAQVVKGQVDGWIQTDDKVGLGWAYNQETGDFTETVNHDIQAIRDGAAMARAPFCLKLYDLGILPASEAIEAGEGKWPATFSSFASDLSERDAVEAQTTWAGAMNIHYNHPTLQALALAHASGDQTAATALLDQIFGLA